MRALAATVVMMLTIVAAAQARAATIMDERVAKPAAHDADAVSRVTGWFSALVLVEIGVVFLAETLSFRARSTKSSRRNDVVVAFPRLNLESAKGRARTGS